MTVQTAIEAWQPRDLQASLEAADRAERLDALLLGTNIPRERFIGMTIQAVARQPKLLRCTRESVLLAVLSVAEMGLVPSGPYGGAWLVPYGDTAQYIVDWRGFLKMAYRSGQLRDAYAKVRYSDEEFMVTEGTVPMIHHVIELSHAIDAVPTHFYAVAHLTTGGHVQHVMSADEVWAIRDRQRNWQSGPWASDPLEMGRKTVVRNLFKYIPEAITPQLAQALEHEDALDAAPAPAVAPLSDRRQRLLARYAGNDAAGDTPPPDTDEPTAGVSAGLGGPADEDEGMPEIPGGPEPGPNVPVPHE
jgi:recombination protein RecT